MSNLRLFSYNWMVQDATEFTIDTADEDVFYPIENLKIAHTTKVFRSPDGITSLEFIADFKSNVPLDSCLIKGHAVDGMKVSAVNIKGSGTLDFSSPLFNEDLDINTENNLGSAFFIQGSPRYVKFTVSYTSGYVELGSIFIGLKTELANNNIDYGWTFKNADNSESKSNKYGNLFIDKYNKIKGFSADFRYLTKEELKILNDVFEYNGTTIPLWMIVDPGELIYDEKEYFAGYFYLAEMPEQVNDAFALYNLSFGLRGVV